MTRDTFDDAISWLQRYHNRTLSAEAIAAYWRDFEHVPDDAFAHAVEETSRKAAPGQFPTREMLAASLSFQREKAWRRVKERENKRPLSNPQGSEKFKAMVAELNRRMAGEITQEELERRVTQLVGGTP